MLILTVLLTCTFILARGAPLEANAFTFKMPVGTALVGQPDLNGLEWASVGPAGPGITIGAGSLSVAGLTSPLGNHARLAGVTGPGARIGLASNVTTGTLYYSLALRVADLGTLGTNGGTLAAFNNATGASPSLPAPLAARLLIRLKGTNYQLGLSATSPNTDDYWLEVALRPNDLVFVVVACELSDVITTRLWLNPSPAAFGISVGDEPESLSATSARNIDQLSSFVLMQEPALPALTLVDEIRVGTTWASVTPPAAALVGYSSGSTGAYGPLNVLFTTTLDLTADGIIHATDVSIAAGATLRFNKNANNTPVSLLARGRVVINGIIDVSGGGGDAVRGGQGGPGGYDGGFPQSGGNPPGEGYGLGRARLGSGGGGAAAHRTGPNTVDISGYNPVASGQPYGSVLQNPVEGGSGGSGIDVGGGGGGGAILIVSDTEIVIGSTGAINANGAGAAVNRSNPGSGGGVRLVAPKVSGTGSIYVAGGDVYFGFSLRGRASEGYVRIDTLDRSALSINAPGMSIGSSMNTIFDEVEDFEINIAEVAGTVIPKGSGPVTIVRPVGSNSNITVKVVANGFNALVPVRLCAIPDSGPGAGYSATLNNTAGPAEHTFNFDIPVNVRVTLNAFAGKDVPPVP